LYQPVKKNKIKRINRIDALNILVISKSVNYFLEDMKDAHYLMGNLFSELSLAL
jgi:hypothetical protein